MQLLGPRSGGNCRDRLVHWSKTLELRVGGFEEYLTRVRAVRTWPPVRSDEGERMLERTLRYELAPLPDGTYRRRALRQAVETEWASIVAADSLGALRRLRCPVLIVQAVGPWRDGRPYFTDAIVRAQMQAVARPAFFLARDSDHSTLIRDPEPGLITAIRAFVTRCADRRSSLSNDPE